MKQHFTLIFFFLLFGQLPHFPIFPEEHLFNPIFQNQPLPMLLPIDPSTFDKIARFKIKFPIAIFGPIFVEPFYLAPNEESKNNQKPHHYTHFRRRI